MDRGEELQDRHNEGQRDAAEERGYNEPHGGLSSFLGTNTDKQMEENAAYRDG